MSRRTAHPAAARQVADGQAAAGQVADGQAAAGQLAAGQAADGGRDASLPWLVPAVLQVSAMDCGPAALASVLAAFGRHTPLGKLRDACHTGRDGTSIDVLEAVAAERGLRAEQILVPADHLTLPAARCCPCLLVITLPGGLPHFVVLWRVLGDRAQVMDPAAGRRWPRLAELQRELYLHRAVVPAAAWNAWARSSPGLLAPLDERLRRLGLAAAVRQATIDAAIDDSAGDWRPLAALDAAVRFLDRRVAARRLRRGGEAERRLAALLAAEPQPPGHGGGGSAHDIPASCWSAWPAAGPAAPSTRLCVQGALLVRVGPAVETGAMVARTSAARPWATPPATAQSATAGPGAARPAATRSSTASPAARAAGEPAAVPLSRHLEPTVATAAVATGGNVASPRPRRPPGARRLRLIGVVSTTAAAAARVVELPLWAAAPALLEANSGGAAPGLRFMVLGALAVAGAGAGLLEAASATATAGLGRQVEQRWRRRLAAKLPALSDDYFRRRLPADLAERAHLADRLSRGPALHAALLGAATEIGLAAAAIVWLDSGLAGITLATVAGALAAPWLLLEMAAPRRRAARAHAAALGTLLLDVLRRLDVVATHSAQDALGRRHEPLLEGWRQARHAAAATAAGGETVLQAVLAAAAATLVLTHVQRYGIDATALAVALLASRLAAAGQALARSAARELADHRALLRRLDEALAIPDEAPQARPISRSPPVSVAGAAGAAGAGGVGGDGGGGGSGGRDGDGGAGGEVRVRLRQAGLVLDGIPVLHGVDLTVRHGEHVAVLGASGAGKSTLFGLLLGWHRPTTGSVEVDGAIAWASPEVALWNDSLLANLRPRWHRDGMPPGLAPSEALRQVGLLDLAARLPAGLQSGVGEAGAGLSGGEAQRLRLARALGVGGAGVVLLDEPCRAVRHDWHDAALLCITHSPSEALDFERALVLEDGRVVEDGDPRRLAAAPDSRLRALLEAQNAAAGALSGRRWRQLRLRDGCLEELDPGAAAGAEERREAGRVAGAGVAALAGYLVTRATGATGARVGISAIPAIATISAIAVIAASQAIEGLGWVILGSGALAGRLSSAAAGAWGLLVLTVPFVHGLELAVTAALDDRLATALRHRLFAGALALAPAALRHEGAGALLGRLLAAESREAGLLPGLTGLAVAAAELGAAAMAAAGGAAPAGQLAVVAAALAAGVLGARRLAADHREAARLRQRLTGRLVEDLAGHRTRRAEGWRPPADRPEPADWPEPAEPAEQAEPAERAPESLAYRTAVIRLDRHQNRLSPLLPRAAALASLGALAGAPAHPASWALSLAAVLLLHSGLAGLARAIRHLAAASTAGRQLAPILIAAGGGAPHAEHESQESLGSQESRQSEGSRQSWGSRASRESRGSRQSRESTLLETRHLTQRPPGAPAPLLDDVSLSIQAGDRLVLRGASGAGKSTLAAILAAQQQASSGLLLLHGYDLHTLGAERWRRAVIAVPQLRGDPLFAGSLAWNLLLGRGWPPAPADLAAAERVCQDIGLGGLLARLPAGLDQQVGAAGWQLSDGETARVCLARALLQEPELLILDESLSALDPPLRRQVIAALEHFPGAVLLIDHAEPELQ